MQFRRSDGTVALIFPGKNIREMFIVAQCFASRRLQVPVDSFARVARIDAHCRDLPAFRAAAPENQADFEA